MARVNPGACHRRLGVADSARIHKSHLCCTGFTTRYKMRRTPHQNSSTICRGKVREPPESLFCFMSQEQTTEHVESFCGSQTEIKAIDDPIVTGALDGLRFSTTSHLTDLDVNYLEQCLTHWCIAQAPDCVLCGVKTAHEGFEWSSAGQLRFVWLCVGCTYEHERTLCYKLPNPAGH